jgi:predicted DNA-binding transcriptional regulator YafY
MRADRLLRMLLLIHSQPRLTASRLAETLEVSERTVYRDIDALCTAGIPIYTQSGPNGGIFLDDNYRVSLNALSQTELVSLFVAAGVGPLKDLGLADAAQKSLLKLLADMPSFRRDNVQHARQRIHIDPANWFQQVESVPFIDPLQQAVWEDRVIQIVYQHPTGEQVRRTLEPYALVAKANIWYLVARQPAKDMRTYRVARIQDAQLTGTHFRRSLDFDLETYWQSVCRGFETEMIDQFTPYPAVISIHPELMWYFENFLGGCYEILERSTADGWIRLRVVFPSRDDALMRVLGLGVHITVVEPPELHQQVLATARAILAFHEQH